jgi:hypothetical protein
MIVFFGFFASLTEVEVLAYAALVPYTNNWVSAAPIALKSLMSYI